MASSVDERSLAGWTACGQDARTRLDSGDTHRLGALHEPRTHGYARERGWDVGSHPPQLHDPGKGVRTAHVVHGEVAGGSEHRTGMAGVQTPANLGHRWWRSGWWGRGRRWGGSWTAATQRRRRGGGSPTATQCGRRIGGRIATRRARRRRFAAAHRRWAPYARLICLGATFQTASCLKGLYRVSKWDLLVWWVTFPTASCLEGLYRGRGVDFLNFAGGLTFSNWGCIALSQICRGVDFLKLGLYRVIWKGCTGLGGLTFSNLQGGRLSQIGVVQGCRKGCTGVGELTFSALQGSRLSRVSGFGYRILVPAHFSN